MQKSIGFYRLRHWIPLPQQRLSRPLHMLLTSRATQLESNVENPLSLSVGKVAKQDPDEERWAGQT